MLWSSPWYPFKSGSPRDYEATPKFVAEASKRRYGTSKQAARIKKHVAENPQTGCGTSTTRWEDPLPPKLAVGPLKDVARTSKTGYENPQNALRGPPNSLRGLHYWLSQEVAKNKNYTREGKRKVNIFWPPLKVSARLPRNSWTPCEDPLQDRGESGGE